VALETLDAQRAGLRRLFASAFLADFGLYLVHTTVPFKALRLGADPFVLGALAAASTGTYALLAGLAGRLSDRATSRSNVARVSCAGVVLACLLLTWAPRLGWMLLFMPIVGGSLSLFWPNVQASVAERSTLGTLRVHLGRFNLSWSLGKSAGFLLGGLLVTTLGVPGTFTVACCVAVLIFFAIPEPPGTPAGPIDALLRRSSGGVPGAATDEVSELAREAARATIDSPSPSAPAELEALDERAPLFRRMAWSANCAAFGLGSTLIYHYPRLVSERGWSPRFFGLFLGGVYLTQTLTFAFLMLRPEAWRFRRLRLYVPQAVMLLAMLSLPLASMGRVLVSALVFGAGLGICYYSSIYYSLHTHTSRGRNAGVHEALIGLGSMAIPLLGGFLARRLGTLWMPYLVAAAAIALSLVVQEVMYRAGTAAARGQTAPRGAGSSGLGTASR
jgi:MFS family permease